ncbi:hypothetical protein HMPREF1055_00942 [Bacteroides fragilis CL07T00C01]|uniref:Uncharacterized protein n=1 Tax=Bacteroides fragilis CL07T12C05 TaxID=997883 RepID=A0A0E2AP59_BACFG|nr:hypothetical protein [Bacteroides fragilis]EIK40206.1 hypothetical protein HMPREF1055_00942 [Bacteroides fragilis CL07T00C01]EIY96093.1 hypothetical protein HMPREF1056_01981 [Bacteroides fragilis CL07T12C05]MCE9143152.1 Rrf2 family transcriptional regulator [Bacteroides fragilis]MCI7229353.1 Rrf2 family transcriptional regulator [Bacteroides fragilis]
MLSICTQTAIAVLQDIHSRDCLRSVNFLLTEEEFNTLLCKLETSGLIRSLPDRAVTTPSNVACKGLLRYQLSRPLHEFTLLDVLQALNEPINCNQPTPESYYLQHGAVASKIGVLNQVTRTFLSEIKLIDL